ncbi:MAG: outer membrane protein assembly factor BamA [Candidatus Latescibacterota bacterium]|nr:MAG: outer membrane protein assembly factor BamA [Candidatus Latescibacterota bacterium]
MKRAFALIAGCIVVLHLFSLPAGAETVVQAIEIEGNKHVSQEKILRIVRIKPGDPYNDAEFTDAAKRLFATKEFFDVQVFKEQRGDRVVVTIIVKEHTRIDEVRFEGNKKIKDEDLAEATAVKEGAFIRPSLLRSDHLVIEDKYREKGYYKVSVKDDIEVERDKKTKKTRTILIYKIDEGEKVEIKHIDFFGNRTLDSGEIRGAMESKEDRWYRGGEFKPKLLEEDTEKITSLYREHGFLDIEVVDKELVFSEDGKDLDVFITVEEGTQYKVGDVTWRGNEVFDDTRIGSKVTFERGDVFNDAEFTNIQTGINELYWDRGYIYNSVSPEKKVKDDIIDVDFEIVEGEPAHINEINISGNTKTAERVIRRELVVHPGDVFLRPRLLRSLREVFNLGFFEGPPEPVVQPANEEGDIDITLKVKERQTGQFRLGAGFSSLNSISGFIGVAETNFLGKGQQIGVDWEFSKYRQNVDLRFTEPWLFGTPTELSINLFNRIQNQVRQQFYNDRRRGVSLRVGRPFPWFDYTSVFLRYRYEEIELTNFASGYTGPLLSIEWPQRTSSVALTILRNSTDSPFHPTTGTRSSLTAELNGGRFLGGDVRFQRYEAGFSWYETLLWKFVLEMKYNAAVLDGYSSPSQVPDYELFRLGGNRRYGVRGYDFYEIVPRGNLPFLGGRFMHTLSYEISFPVAPTIYALAFFDGGNTWNSFRGANFADLKKGIGIGVRIDLPMLGTIGFDYGYGFDKVDGAGWEPHLTLGAGF